MDCLVNGEVKAQIGVTDRGLQYGDGLFETIALRNGKLEFWSRHMARLHKGCQRLALAPPDAELLAQEARKLCAQQRDGVLKIILTRHSAGRGYQAPIPSPTNRIVTLHPWPDYPSSFARLGVSVQICQTRLGSNPTLAGLKHLNRLEQVLARQEWCDPNIVEGIMLDGHGNAIEGVMSNLFLVRDGQLWSPNLSNCGVAGIMREVVVEIAKYLDIPVKVEVIPEAELYRAEALFLTNSITGIWPVKQLGEHRIKESPLSRQISAELGHRRVEEAYAIL